MIIIDDRHASNCSGIFILRANKSSPCALLQETQLLSRALTPFPSRHSPQRIPAKAMGSS